MQGLNTVTLGGNLCRDAELRMAASGTAVLSFSVAVNESVKDRNGEWSDYPNYIDCTMFGRRAESVAPYLTKGAYVAVVGRLHQNRWKAQDGQNRSKVEVLVDNVHFESRADRAEAAHQQGGALYDEDIPF
jgi:single-strand DNA-binding protein|nr:MAG TPA: Single strand binding protein [Caudoviricetes sp.]